MSFAVWCLPLSGIWLQDSPRIQAHLRLPCSFLTLFLHEQHQRQGFKCSRCIWEVTPGSRSEEQGEWEWEGGDPVRSAPMDMMPVGTQGSVLQNAPLNCSCGEGGRQKHLSTDLYSPLVQICPSGNFPFSLPFCPVWAERLSKEPRGAVQGVQFPGRPHHSCGYLMEDCPVQQVSLLWLL